MSTKLEEMGLTEDDIATPDQRIKLAVIAIRHVVDAAQLRRSDVDYFKELVRLPSGVPLHAMRGKGVGKQIDDLRAQAHMLEEVLDYLFRDQE